MTKGSIEKRGANSWRLVVELGLNADGHLDDALAAFKREVESGSYVKQEKMILDDFFEKEWIPNTVKAVLVIERGPKSNSSKRNVEFPEWFIQEMSQFREEWLKKKEEVGSRDTAEKNNKFGPKKFVPLA